MEQEKNVIRFCPNCGSTVETNEVFCGNCGTPIHTEIPEQIQVETTQPPQDKTKKKTKLFAIITIVAGAVLLLIGMIILVTFFLLTVLTFTPETKQATESSSEYISEQSGNYNSSQKNNKEFNEKEIISQLDVKTYSYNSDYSSYCFMIIKNNSAFNLDINVDAKFYNTSGDLVGAKSSNQEAFQQGTETILYFLIDEKYSKFDYEINVDKENYYDCVISDLSYKTASAKHKEIVSVTNNGNEAAEFVETYILFFKGDKVVGFDHCYFTDDDYELKPGKTITKELNCYKTYDSINVYMTGRR